MFSAFAATMSPYMGLPTASPCLATAPRLPGFGWASARYPLLCSELSNPRGFRRCQSFILSMRFLMDWLISTAHLRYISGSGWTQPGALALRRLMVSQGSWAGCCLLTPGSLRGDLGAPPSMGAGFRGLAFCGPASRVTKPPFPGCHQAAQLQREET